MPRLPSQSPAMMWCSAAAAIAALILVMLPVAAVEAADRPVAEQLALPDPVLATLRPEHPRLHLIPQRLAAIQTLVRDDPLAAEIYAGIRKEADAALKKKPSQYEKRDGRRLLPVSREVLQRVTNLAFLYRMTGERKYADRAWTELSAAAAFPDWNPAHFLDTAEMTYALAIGYDWLYDCWSAEQRTTLRQAIVEKGLTPALKNYEPKPRGWATVTNNWNQVCNGGIALGALAIAEEQPELAARIVRTAVAQIPRAIHVYQPDGAGTEGVTYWSYATRYNTALLDALETSLGSCLGLDKVDGYEKSADFQLYFSGASHLSFNFGDCGETRLSTPQHFWFGKHYGTARHVWFRHDALRQQGDRGQVADLLWYDAAVKDFDSKTLPLDKHFRGAEVAVMRSAWGDPNALVLGIEGAPTADYSHRHLDSGSFILEADGVRWIIDCGTEHETYLSHQHSHGRWDFYRTRAEGHNTLVLNPDKGPDQTPKTPAPITRFESRPERCVAEMDLTKAYEVHAKHVTRTYQLLDRKRVSLTDRIEGARSAELWWFLHTKARIEVAADGRSATFAEGSKRLQVVLREPSSARFEVRDAVALAGSPKVDKQADNSKIRKLAIHLRDINDLTLAVDLMPAP